MRDGIVSRLPSDISGQLPRAWVSLSDQAVSSATNFALALFSARLVGPRGLGTVTVGLAVAYAGISLERALVGEPLLVLARAEGTRGALGTAIAAGLVLGLAAAGVGAWLGGEVGVVIAVVGICGPVLLFQDALRYEAIAVREPERALTSDLVWFGTQAVLLVALTVFGLRNPVLVVTCWGLGAVAGTTVFLGIQLRKLALSGVPDWLKRSARLSGWMAGQTAIGQTGTQVTLVTVGAVTGLAGLGIFRSVLAIAGPLAVLLLGLGLLALPALADAQAVGIRALKAQVVRWTTLAGLVSITYAALMVVLREPLFTGLFGSRFELAVPLAWPAGISVVMLGLASAPGWASRAVSAGWAVLATQVVGTAVGIPATVLMAVSSGPMGAAWGIAVQSSVLCGSAWLTFWLALRKHEHS